MKILNGLKGIFNRTEKSMLIGNEWKNYFTRGVAKRNGPAAKKSLKMGPWKLTEIS